MLCQNCNENEANVTYIQTINGNKKEMILCEKCYKELGIDEMKFNMPLSFSNIFGDFLEPELSFIPKLAIPEQLKCDTCGMTYDDFVLAGKFGCANCYHTFSEKIDPILKRLHGSTQYAGKRQEKEIERNSTHRQPVKRNEGKEEPIKNVNEKKLEKTKEEQIEELKDKLKKLIKLEKYEEAALIRDEIKKQEGGKNEC